MRTYQQWNKKLERAIVESLLRSIGTMHGLVSLKKRVDGNNRALNSLSKVRLVPPKKKELMGIAEHRIACQRSD